MNICQEKAFTRNAVFRINILCYTYRINNQKGIKQHDETGKEFS